MAFREQRQAVTHHVCDWCRRDICPSEYYDREAVPPWETGDGRWFVSKRCFCS